MSWQVTAYALLALVLAGGIAWYERSRPPARMVALVAALAALAVAGRLVFAPIPNVVATTDIVLITGYAVGPAPGFAVGALAAVSPISGSARGRGRPGRWRGGAWSGWVARRSPWPPGAAWAAAGSPPPAGSRASHTGRSSISR